MTAGRKKLVVTGALGHIGSRFIRVLRPDEWAEVALMDDLSGGRPADLSGLPPGIRFRFHPEDVLSADLAHHFEGAYAVVHLAAVADPERALADPDGVERINLEGTARVARACAAAGARMVFPSSTSVYGEVAGPKEGEIVLEENTGALNPRGPYAEGKLRAERLLAELARTEKLRHAVARFGTVFGVSPGMHFRTAVNRFAWQACAGFPLTVWRTALRQKRPYLDVSDAAAAIALLLRRDLFGGETWNVATTDATVEDVVTLLRRHIPGLEVRLVDSPLMTASGYVLSIRKIRAAGFLPSGSLERGIADVVACLRNARIGEAG